VSAAAPLTGLVLYRRLLGYASPHYRVFLLAVLAMLVFAMTDTGFAALMKPMLDGSFVEHDPEAIRFVPLALIGLFMVRGVAGFALRYGMSWIGRQVILALRRDLFRHLLALPCQYFDQNPSGYLLSRMTFDVEQVAEATTNAITVLIRDTLTMLFLIAYMFWISGWLTLLFLVVGPVLIGLIRYVTRRFRRISRRIQDSMGDLTRYSEETIHGQRLVKSFGGQRWQERQFERVNENNRRLHLKMAAALGASTPLVQLISAAVLALVVYLATLESMRNEISVGSFVSFIAAMMLLMQPMKRLTNINASIQRGLAAAQSIFGLLDEELEQDQGKVHVDRVAGVIEFRNVCFAYPQSKNEVLTDISFSVSPGETIALVGHSGSGKTTLAHLLLRFYQPRQGEILLDGRDIRDYQLSSLRQQIAMVGQDVVLFNDSIAHNIAYGRPGEATRGDIAAAAARAHATEFIDALPQGLDSPVGDRGMLLSGGQRQRVAIARALFKDAPVLILDEATSSLDSESERVVQDALEILSENRTSLVIAHRLSTVEKADRILVMEAGRIIDTGSHSELLQRGGLYADLYRLQFKDPPAL
jgi:subfamily B ATP-binding cassette protein MsbA